MRHVGGVIVAGFKGGAEVSAQKRGSKFGYQFRGHVGIFAKTFVQGVREAGRADRSARKLVRLCRQFDT